jgi:thiamine biosynthesis lipoprotein
MLKHKKKLLVLFFVMLSIFILIFLKWKSTNSKETIEPISKSDFCLGTVVEIKIYDKASEDTLTDVFNILKRIENRMSLNLENSEICKINKSAGKEEVKVSPETFSVIKRSIYYSSRSNGLFDISIGPLVKLWGIGSDNARLPSPNEISSTIKKIGYKNIILDEANHSVKLAKEGMMLDLGAIAKGYAADEIAKYLKSKNIQNAIINLGGNVYAMGSNPNSKPWNIGIQNPIDSRGNNIGAIHVRNKTVVTSGVYERYFEKDGKRYHHILNPFTGYPADNSLISVSIVADKSIDADGLSTTTFSMGLKDGSKLIESLDGVDALFITKDNNVYITSGLKGNFLITDDNFKFMKSID